MFPRCIPPCSVLWFSRQRRDRHYPEQTAITHPILLFPAFLMVLCFSHRWVSIISDLNPHMFPRWCTVIALVTFGPNFRPYNLLSRYHFSEDPFQIGTSITLDGSRAQHMASTLYEVTLVALTGFSQPRPDRVTCVSCFCVPTPI